MGLLDGIIDIAGALFGAVLNSGKTTQQNIANNPEYSPEVRKKAAEAARATQRVQNAVPRMKGNAKRTVRAVEESISNAVERKKSQNLSQTGEASELCEDNTSLRKEEAEMAMITCFWCGGSGRVPCDCTGDMGSSSFADSDCPACGGAGVHTCPNCNGSGKVND